MTIITKNPALGNRIRRIRLMLGKNQTEFGKLFDPPAPKGAVSRWEHGGSPNKPRLRKIADLGGVSVDFLLTGDLHAEVVNSAINKLDDGKAHKLKDIWKLPLSDKEKQAVYSMFVDIDRLNNIARNDAGKRIKLEQPILEKQDLQTMDLQTYGFFLSLFNLIVEYGTKKQKQDFNAIINSLWQTATGRMKYDKNDMLSVLDPFMRSLPIKKDDHKSDKDKKQS